MLELNKENLFKAETLQFLAKEIIQNAKNFYCSESGILVKSVSSQGKILDKRDLLEDLGDYLPFFLYFGEDNFCQKQITELKKALTNNLLSPYQKKRGFPYIAAFSHTDLLLGLLDYCQLRGEKEALVLAEKTIKECVRRFKISRTVNSFYLSTLKFSVPVFDTIDGSFIELFVEFYKLTKNKYYLKKARELIEGIEKSTFFQKHSLISERIFKDYPSFFNLLFKSKAKKVKVMKNNTNTLYGFLEYYKITGDKHIKNLIEKWFKGFCRYLISPSGGVLYELKGKISLVSSFATLDLFCDLYYFLGDRKYLTEAKKIANFWLEQQSPRTGLFPAEKGGINSNLDAETDMVIALVKLSELTRDSVYKTAAKKAFEGIIKYHRKKMGYVLEVNIENGEVINDVFKVKFITLFLKAIILFLEQKSIYQNKMLFNLLKDR